jgi:hypothetical protein
MTQMKIKGSRRRRREFKNKMDFNDYELPPGTEHWLEDDGMHYILPGTVPSPEHIEEMTRDYQENIRNSELFNAWVKEFGIKRAEELLQECRVKIEPC